VAEIVESGENNSKYFRI